MHQSGSRIGNDRLLRQLTRSRTGWRYADKHNREAVQTGDTMRAAVMLFSGLVVSDSPAGLCPSPTNPGLIPARSCGWRGRVTWHKKLRL